MAGMRGVGINYISKYAQITQVYYGHYIFSTLTADYLQQQTSLQLVEFMHKRLHIRVLVNSCHHVHSSFIQSTICVTL